MTGDRAGGKGETDCLRNGWAMAFLVVKSIAPLTHTQTIHHHPLVGTVVVQVVVAGVGLDSDIRDQI